MRFSIIYVKKTERTPKKTTITFTFPNGKEVDYEADNAILDEIPKEQIMGELDDCEIIVMKARQQEIFFRDVIAGQAYRVTNSIGCFCVVFL